MIVSECDGGLRQARASLVLVVHGAPGRTGLAGCDEVLLDRSIGRCLGVLPPETVVYGGHDPGAVLGLLLPALAAVQRS